MIYKNLYEMGLERSNNIIDDICKKNDITISEKYDGDYWETEIIHKGKKVRMVGGRSPMKQTEIIGLIRSYLRSKILKQLGI